MVVCTVCKLIAFIYPIVSRVWTNTMKDKHGMRIFAFRLKREAYICTFFLI